MKKEKTVLFLTRFHQLCNTLYTYAWLQSAFISHDSFLIVIFITVLYRLHVLYSYSSIIFISLLVRIQMPTHALQPRTWLVFGTSFSYPLKTSASNLMSCTISSPMTGSPWHLQLPSQILSGRYFPPLLPSALAGVGKPPKPASLLPPPLPLLPLFFYPASPSWDELLQGLPVQRGQSDPCRHAWKN